MQILGFSESRREERVHHQKLLAALINLKNGLESQDFALRFFRPHPGILACTGSCKFFVIVEKEIIRTKRSSFLAPLTKGVALRWRRAIDISAQKHDSFQRWNWTMVSKKRSAQRVGFHTRLICDMSKRTKFRSKNKQVAISASEIIMIVVGHRVDRLMAYR